MTEVQGMSPCVGQRILNRAFNSPDIRCAFATRVLSFIFLIFIQSALKGENLLVQARTGTGEHLSPTTLISTFISVLIGKTLAFLLPAVETVAKSPTRGGVSVLILAPTRELAQQVTPSYPL